MNIRCFVKIIFCLSILNFSHAQQITIITGNDYGPYTDEKLPDGGVYTYFVKQILNKMEFKYSIEFYPWARGYEMIKRAKAALSFPYIKTVERQAEIIYSEYPLMTSNLYLITNHKKTNSNKNKILDFKGSIICSPVGYAKERSIQEMLSKNLLSEIKEFNAKDCLNAVLEGKADLVATNNEYLLERKKQGMNESLFRKINSPLASNPLYVIFPKSSDSKFIEEFNKQTHIFMSTEEYKKKAELYK